MLPVDVAVCVLLLEPLLGVDAALRDEHRLGPLPHPLVLDLRYLRTEGVSQVGSELKGDL